MLTLDHRFRSEAGGVGTIQHPADLRIEHDVPPSHSQWSLSDLPLYARPTTTAAPRLGTPRTRSQTTSIETGGHRRIEGGSGGGQGMVAWTVVVDLTGLFIL